MKPLITTIDGTPTFLSPPVVSDSKYAGLIGRKSRQELQVG